MAASAAAVVTASTGWGDAGGEGVKIERGRGGVALVVVSAFLIPLSPL